MCYTRLKNIRKQQLGHLMKYIVFVFVLIFAPLVFGQELNYSPVSELENGVAKVEKQPNLEKKVPDSPKVVPTTPVIQPKNACAANKTKYLESASRKLYRAISGKGYKIKKIGLKSLSVGDHRFEIVPQKDGKVLGLLSKSHSHGYVAINTTRGHIITKMKWKNCRPVSTTIVSPKVSVPSVDMEPFKYWGLRVLWTLPNRLGKTKNIKDSLTKIIKAD